MKNKPLCFSGLTEKVYFSFAKIPLRVEQSSKWLKGPGCTYVMAGKLASGGRMNRESPRENE